MSKYSAAVIGMDLGDRRAELCVLDRGKTVLWRKKVKMGREDVREFFEIIEPTIVVIEAGTHSAWVSELLESLGHNVIVANPRSLRLISRSYKKNDRNDAEILARLGLADPVLLNPIVHRRSEDRADLVYVQSRCALVEARTKLTNYVRGIVKSFGYRLRSCSAETFHKLEQDVPECLQDQLAPSFGCIKVLTIKIKSLDKKIETLCEEKYPETRRFRQIRGVGPVTALVFALVIEDPSRFDDSRQVGAYLGLVPRQHQSGAVDRQLRITKAGHRYLRSLLVQCAHYILGCHGDDCDLRDFGLRLFERGGKYAKARAAVAVARKLAVLMHRLWVTGEDYDRLRARRQRGGAVKIYKLEVA